MYDGSTPLDAGTKDALVKLGINPDELEDLYAMRFLHGGMGGPKLDGSHVRMRGYNPAGNMGAGYGMGATGMLAIIPGGAYSARGSPMGPYAPQSGQGQGAYLVIALPITDGKYAGGSGKKSGNYAGKAEIAGKYAGMTGTARSSAKYSGKSGGKN
jgi:hypothetical protein